MLLINLEQGRIIDDAEVKQELAKAKKIDAIPYLEMYKNGVKTWSSVGLIGKEELNKSLRD